MSSFIVMMLVLLLGFILGMYVGNPPFRAKMNKAIDNMIKKTNQPKHEKKRGKTKKPPVA